MTDNSQEDTIKNLPPKLDLRKDGVLKNKPEPVVSSVEAPPVEPEVATAPVETKVATAQPAPTISPAEERKPVSPDADSEADTTIHIKSPDNAQQENPLAQQKGSSQSQVEEAKQSIGVNIKKPVPVATPQPVASAIKSTTTATIGQQPVKPLNPLSSGETPVGKLSMSKKNTSKISLESVASGQDLKPVQPLNAPKTVRIKSPGIPSPTVMKPKSIQQMQKTASQNADIDEKRKTSRISLDATLSLNESITDKKTSGPKTIKLKRPGEATTLKVAQPTKVEKMEEIASDEPLKSNAGETARFNIVPDDQKDSITPTSRSTIRLKQPTKRPSVKSSAVEDSIEEAPEGDKLKKTLEVATDQPGWVFSLLAVAAIIVAIALIYVLTAQAFPDMNLTVPGMV